jgi:hypothetical protein
MAQGNNEKMPGEEGRTRALALRLIATATASYTSRRECRNSLFQRFSAAVWRLPDARLSLHSIWPTFARRCRRGDGVQDQYPFNVSYFLTSSRAARISRSVVIALSDPSLSLFLESTRARRLQRSLSKSSSRSRFIATSGFYLKETFRPGTPGRAKRQATWLAFALPTILSLSPVGIPGMVTIDHFGRDVWMRRKNTGAAKSCCAAELGPRRRQFSLSPIGTHPAGWASVVNGSHVPERGRLPVKPRILGVRKRAGLCTWGSALSF